MIRFIDPNFSFRNGHKFIADTLFMNWKKNNDSDRQREIENKYFTKQADRLIVRTGQKEKKQTQNQIGKVTRNKKNGFCRFTSVHN